MLVLSRKINESIKIGDDVEIMIVRAENGKVRIGITAPRHVPITRSELPTREARTESAPTP
jgi:carbon storage regulator